MAAGKMTKYVSPKKAMGQRLNKRQKSEVKRLIAGAVDTKTAQTTLTLAASDVVGDIKQVFAGLGSADRIQLKKLNVRYTITPSPTDLVDYVRLIIFRWKEIDTTPPVIDDVLSISFAGDYLLGDYNEVLKQNYHIMYDKVVTLTQSQYYNGMASIVVPNSNGAFIGQANIFGKKLGSKYINGANGGPCDNTIYVLAVSNSTAGTLPAIQMTAQLYFTDA